MSTRFIISLIGLRASGKTSLASMLGQMLGAPVFDTDEVIQRAGKSVAQIVAESGWEGFRRTEKAVLASVMDVCFPLQPTIAAQSKGESSPVSRIVATGGGMVLDPENRRLLRENSLCFYLKTRPCLLATRLMADPLLAQRPALSVNKEADAKLAITEEIRQTSKDRERFYAEASHHVLDGAQSLNALAEEILGFVAAKGGCAQ